MIADTDFLISLADDDPGAVRTVAELEDRNEPIKIPTMALLEFYIGVGAVATDAQERETRRVLERHPSVPMDEDVAMRAGRRIGELGPKEFKKDKGDAVIGATAEVEGEKVLTRNVEDFESLGFGVEKY
jgi:predicted nucleic acid-binding protein